MGRPVKPRDAASLVLVRNASRGPEVLLGRRAPRNRFMPDVYVFPGGGVSPEDRSTPVVAELSAEVERGLATPAGGANPRALAVAAVRETFEETGLWIGKPSNEGFAPDLSKLVYLARAITPSSQPVRYHARFFLAEDRHAGGTLAGNGELLDLAWVRLQRARALPIVDVTGFVLDQVERYLAGQHRRAPLIYYRNNEAYFRYSDRPRNPDRRRSRAPG